jgi:hypothetical protein
LRRSCVVRQPGTLHVFYQRIRARRGHQVAVVACARKLACLFWCMLTRQQDYACQQPSLTKKKLRRLELQAGAERGKVKPGIWSANKAIRTAERDLAQQAELAYQRTVADWQAATSTKGASATPGRITRPSNGSSAARHQSQTLRFGSSSPAPTRTLTRSAPRVQRHLTFIRRAKQHSAPGGAKLPSRLPELVSPELDRLYTAIADDHFDTAEGLLPAVLERVDTPDRRAAAAAARPPFVRCRGRRVRRRRAPAAGSRPAPRRRR